MTHEATSTDFPMQLWGPDIFPECLSLIDGAVESLEIRSQQSPDAERSNQDSPPEADTAEPALKSRKRGRPRVLDDDGSDAAMKERRKIQLRIAQRAYRSRKEEQIAKLSKKVTELEQKLLIYQTSYLGIRAATVASGFPIGLPTQEEPIAGVEGPAITSSIDMQFAAFIPDPEASASQARNSAPAQLVSPTIPSPMPPGASYMMLEEGSGYGNWTQANHVSIFPFT